MSTAAPTIQVPQTKAFRAVELHTFQEFNRTDGPVDAIARGGLTGRRVALFGADASGAKRPFRSEGMMLALLGTADTSTLRRWFSQLSEGGLVVDDLQKRPWARPMGKSSIVMV